MSTVRVFMLTLFLFSIPLHGQATKAERPYLAFSLRQASVRHGSGDSTPSHLGGITRIAAMVFDRKGHDIILVGLCDSRLPAGPSPARGY